MSEEAVDLGVFTIQARRCKRCGGLLTRKKGFKKGMVHAACKRSARRNGTGKSGRTNTVCFKMNSHRR